MKRKSSGLCLTAVCAVLFAASLFLFAYHSKTAAKDLWNKSELAGSKLFVHNVTCSEPYETRTVSDPAFQENVSSLCSKAVRFRPAISYDLVLGDHSDAYFIFKNDTIQFTVTLFDIEKQLSLDYSYRDSPMVLIAKTQIDDAGRPHPAWKWYCSLPADDFAFLCEAIQTYTGGEFTK